MLRFFLTALVIFIGAYAYLGWSMAEGRTWVWITIGIPFLCILCMPLTVWGRDRRENVHIKEIIANTAYASMGILTYIFVFTIARDVVWWIADLRLGNLFIVCGSGIALVLGALVALLGPKVKRVEVKYEGLPQDLDGFKIAQISDLHVGGAITRAYVERVVRKANAEAPDMVALTGDIGDGDSVASRYGIDPLSQLQPRGRVFYVSGNHEYYWNIKEWLQVFAELGAKTLHNRSETIRHKSARVLVGGIPDKMGGQMKADDKPDVALAAAGEADFKILLSHRPSAARPAAASGFDLTLAGHTHAGQFFPWTLIVRFVHEFHEGLNRVGKMWIYVSHGTGTWGPPLRLGTMPEVTLLTLRRQ